MSTRRSMAATILGLLASAATLAVADPAGASRREGIEITGGQVVTKSYPPIRLNSGGGGAGSRKVNKPADCNTVVYCDTVPLLVDVPPGTPDDSEFVVRISLKWEQTPGPVGTSSNDMDLYLWDDPQGTTDVAHSASSGNPEIANLVSPRKVKYQIVVDNFAGVNQGYELKVEYISGDFTPPDESLDPTFKPEDKEQEGFAAATGPNDDSGSDDPPPPPKSSGSGSGAAFDAGATAPDGSGSGGGLPSFPLPGTGSDAFLLGLPDAGDDPLADTGGGSQLFRPTLGRATGPAGPVPAPVLVFWLVAAPLALLIGGAIIVRRRRPVALTIR